MSDLVVTHLTKAFPQGRDRFLALDDVSIDVKSGELLVLLGASGSGKTTLLRCVAGLTRPTNGHVAIAGRVVFDAAEAVDQATYRRNLGMVFQTFALWPHMTVRENVAYPLRAKGLKDELRKGRVEEVLELVQCSALADRLPATLSGGQQQRIALARALVARPALVLFDEPLSNLDALLRIELRAQLRQLHRATGFTGVYVTHDQLEALTLATRIAVMHNGRIVQLGPPEAIYSRPATEYIADFVGFSNTISLAEGGDHTIPSFDARPIMSRFADLENGSIRFRPEHARATPGAATSNSSNGAVTICDGTVVDRAFLGDEAEFTVRFGSTLVTVRQPQAAAQLEVNDRASVMVALDNVAAFDDSGQRVARIDAHEAVR